VLRTLGMAIDPAAAEPEVKGIGKKAQNALGVNVTKKLKPRDAEMREKHRQIVIKQMRPFDGNSEGVLPALDRMKDFRSRKQQVLPINATTSTRYW